MKNKPLPLIPYTVNYYDENAKPIATYHVQAIDSVVALVQAHKQFDLDLHDNASVRYKTVSLTLE